MILRTGAMFGLLMSVSHIFEHYVLIFSDLDLTTASMVYFFEWIASAAIYVWLLWRSARRVANSIDRRVGLSFGLAWSYIIIISILVGIIIGVANTLFVSYMGYDSFVDGMLERLNQTRELMLATGVENIDDELFVEMRAAVQSAEQPSIFSNILGSMNSYIFTGGIIGLIIAAFVRRKPDMTPPTEVD